MTDAQDTGYLPVMLNPFEPGFFDDPYSRYAAVREQDPVHTTLIGAIALLRYEDVHRVLRDTSMSVEEHRSNLEFPPPSNPELARRMEERRDRGTRVMLNLDPPDHHRLRRLVSKVFTPKMIEGLRPRIEQLVDEHLDAVEARGTGEMDVIADLAFPLPFIVISEMLGVPEQDRTSLREWSGAIVKTFDPILSEEEQWAAMNASDNLDALVRDLIAWKREHPGDDLLSAMIAAEDEGDRLDEDELLGQTMLLYIAGHETTVNLVGNGTLALLRNRDQFELLSADPSVATNGVDELLRYDSPVQMSRRINLEPVTLGGKHIEAGSVLMTALGSANRDPEKFPDPDRLDLRRENAREHMAFGGGFHNCLGAHLARLEGAVAISRMAQRFPRMELAHESQEWNGRIVLRGLNRLPVALG